MFEELILCLGTGAIVSIAVSFIPFLRKRRLVTILVAAFTNALCWVLVKFIHEEMTGMTGSKIGRLSEDLIIFELVAIPSLVIACLVVPHLVNRGSSEQS